MDNQIFVLFIIILIIVISYMSLKEKYDNNFSYAQLGRNYAQLGGNHLLASPYLSSRCAEGPYMYTSNPELQAKCAGVTTKECGTGYYGKPVHFSYSPNLCDVPSPSSLLVL
jgi:hypothetical protein